MSGHPIYFSWPLNGCSLQNSSTYPSTRALRLPHAAASQNKWLGTRGLPWFLAVPRSSFCRVRLEGTESLPQVDGEKEMLGTSAASCLPIPSSSQYPTRRPWLTPSFTLPRIPGPGAPQLQGKDRVLRVS